MEWLQRLDGCGYYIPSRMIRFAVRKWRMVYKPLLSSLLTVPEAAGNTNFSVWRSSVQPRGKKLTYLVESTRKSTTINSRSDISWFQRAIKTKKVGSITGDMGCSHRSSRDGVGLSIVPSGSDVYSRSEDIDGGTEVGEVCDCIIERRSADSDGFFNTGRRGVARVLVLVSGGDNDCNAGRVKLR